MGEVLMVRASEDEVLITRLLEKSIRRTEAVDREALCIVAGEKVGWFFWMTGKVYGVD
jgi:exosome complex RNA-binding protein Rrp42 (RNase PH superfamily)